VTSKKKKRKRRKSMSKQILAVAAVLLLTSFAPQSHAAPSTQANIPFAFQVGNKTMPAGEYRVTRAFEGSDTVQLIRRTDSSAGAFLPQTIPDYTDKNAEPKLVFHCYGKECFLSEVRSADGRSWKFMESRREKQISQAQMESELASISVPLTGKP
jgi:hypothetical protein